MNHKQANAWFGDILTESQNSVWVHCDTKYVKSGNLITH